MKKHVVALTVLATLVAGCVPFHGSHQAGGALLGAGTGALLGSQLGCGRGRLLGVAVGTLAGAMIGQEVGRSLDQADRLAMNQATQRALDETPAQQPTTWVNPDTGHSGSITPIKNYHAANGQYCREYQQSITVAGSSQQAFGTACRQADGSWQIVNTKS